MDASISTKIDAAVKLKAQEETKRRGHSSFRLNKKSVTDFKRTIAVTPINAESQRPTRSSAYINKSKYAFLVPETWETCSGLDAEVGVGIGSKTQSPQTGKKTIKGIRAECKGHIHRRHTVGPSTIPAQCTVRYNCLHFTKTQQYELRTERSIPIGVHPGHPIARHAAIGGVAGAATGAVAGAGTGSLIGGIVGAILGPPGVVVGIFLGILIGGLTGTTSGAGAIGGVGSAIGAAKGFAKRHNVQFTITAEDVFRKLPKFRQEGGNVFCQVAVTHEWDEEQREMTEN